MSVRLARLACLVWLFCLSACALRRADPAPAGATSSKTAQASTRVAKIAFIDQEHGCPCTRGRVEGSWSAVQTALAGRTDVQVERIHSDTQPALASPYTTQRSFSTTPGIYFVDGKAAVVEMLQGEVRPDQITAVLK